FEHTLPKALFVFLPVLALVMQALYRRPRRYYVEHLLFFLHNHAFAFLVFAGLALLTSLIPASAGRLLTWIVWLYVPCYLFLSIRRVYGQGPWLTFAKLVVLSFAYVTGAGITQLLTGIYSIYSF